eukprot:TRINITY_DN1393_c0_g1_i1.p1 TRINITY_DN1393_c0_g1~~TRINITY_DN1393_c0_g1_i1.p1  ORF type:complete len:1310 (-),score=283.52 TRINITY_DN1393_c0_g1_i1:100-4008(-)
MASGVMSKKDMRSAASLIELRDSLLGFREDLELLFSSRKRHNASRQRLKDCYLRLLRSGKAVSEVGVARAADPTRADVAAKGDSDVRHAAPEQRQDSDTSRSKPEMAPRTIAGAIPAKKDVVPEEPLGISRDAPNPRTVGIAGIGKLSYDSPNSKGARAQQRSLSMAELGGEQAVRSMLLEYVSRHSAARQFTSEHIQEIWADEVSASSARVSVLLSSEQGSGVRPGSDCRQFRLRRDGDKRWCVQQMMGPNASNHLEDECESSFVMPGSLDSKLEKVHGDEAISKPENETSERAKLLEVLEKDPLKASCYADLAHMLEQDEVVKIAEKKYGQKELLMKAIRLEPSLGRAYSDLGCVLSFTGDVVVIDGKQYDEKELYIKAIESDHTLQLAYENLSDMLEEGDQVTIDGTVHTRRSLRARASVLDKAQSKQQKRETQAAALQELSVVTSEDKLATSPKSASHVSELDPLDRSTPLAERMGQLGITISPHGNIRSEQLTVLASPSGAAHQEDKAASCSSLESSAQRRNEVRPRKELTGISPLLRPKDFGKLFAEIDADGDGLLAREDLLSFLGDYLQYGEAEILSALARHGGEKGVSQEAFKPFLKELNAYSATNRSKEVVVRKPGAFGGLENVDFRIEDSKDCTFLICDRTEQFQVDDLENCTVVIGPCASSTFLRKCRNCTFWVVTKQFRVYDCKNCTFYLHCHTEPVIEESQDLRIAPFCARYPQLTKQFREAKLDPTRNFWNAVYDFTGRQDRANWEIQPLDNCEELLIAFQGWPEKPESPSPQITQEMLVATPLESGESHGEAVHQAPQTRPPPPPEPRRGQMLQRELSDAAQEHTEPRDLWNSVAVELKQGTLAQEFDIARAKVLETPSSQLAADSAVAEASKLLSSIPIRKEDESAPRDLWNSVAAEIKQGTLAEDFDIARAKALESPSSQLAADSKVAEASKLLSSIPIRKEDESAPRDLWNSVAAEIKQGTLAEDFNIARAKALETPSSHLAADSKADPGKLLSSIPAREEEWKPKARQTESFQVELLEDDDSDTDDADVRPGRASLSAGLHGWSLGSAARPTSFNSASHKARMATASSFASAAAPLQRGGSTSGALAGAAPLGGLRLSGTASSTAQAKASAVKKAPAIDSSDDDEISVGNSSHGSPTAIYSSATARHLFGSTAKPGSQSVRPDLEPAKSKPEPIEKSNHMSILTERQRSLLATGLGGSDSSEEEQPVQRSKVLLGGSGGPSREVPQTSPRRGRQLRRGLDQDSSSTSESDGRETAALASRWGSAAVHLKAKSPKMRLADDDSD